jgi:hypothetical protein
VFHVPLGYILPESDQLANSAIWNFQLQSSKQLRQNVCIIIIIIIIIILNTMSRSPSGCFTDTYNFA